MGLEGDWRKRLEEFDLSKEPPLKDELPEEIEDDESEEEGQVFSFKGGKFALDNDHTIWLVIEKEVYEKFVLPSFCIDWIEIYEIDESLAASPDEIGKYRVDMPSVEPLDEKAQKVWDDSPYGQEAFHFWFYGICPKIVDFIE